MSEKPMAESSEQTTPAWVLAACSEDADRSQLNIPHSVPFRGETWTVGTNGHIMALVKRDLGLPPSTMNWAKVLQAPAVPPLDLDMAALRDWAGCAPVGQACRHCMDARRIACHTCHGEGHTEHECSCGDLHDAECETCCGEKYIDCPRCSPGQYDSKERVRLFNGIFNRTLLRRVLRDFPVAGERFAHGTWRQADDRQVGWIEAVDGGWIIGIMPLDPDTTLLPPDAPFFPSSAVTA